MISVKLKFAPLLVWWKTFRNMKRLNKLGLQLPQPASEIKNVLILLPLDEEHLDAAMTLVRHLRQHFQIWHFMVLDVKRIPSEQLDRFHLPLQTFVDNLAGNDFQLVIDLNFIPDFRFKYLIGSLNIHYRLGVLQQESDYYNLHVHLKQEEFKGFVHILNSLKSSFVL